MFPRPIIIGFSIFAALSLHANVVKSSSTSSGWAPILYLGNSDPTGDQQTGKAGNEADIVGDSVLAALYKYYDGQSLGFRLRLGAQDNKNQGYTSATMIGFDITGDDVLDFYIGADIDGVGKGNEKLDIGIYQFKSGATSPNNTEAALAKSADYLFGYEQSAGNFDWSEVSEIDKGLKEYSLFDPSAPMGFRDVDPYNVDGATDNKGKAQSDHFLTFLVPYADLVAAFQSVDADFDEGSAISFVAITSQNLNQVNNDFNGIDDSSLETFYGAGTTGGGISRDFSSESLIPVPEPASYTLALGCLAFGCVALGRRR